MTPPTSWTAGVVRHGQADPIPERFRYRSVPDRCPEYGHPGRVYHPQMDRTWCTCGEVTYPGEQVVLAFQHPASPLREWWDDEARDAEVAGYVAAGISVPDYAAYRIPCQGDLLANLGAVS